MKDNRVALELRHITKRFGDVVANRDVSLEVRRGEILSLLGENGSGKTTLMNMISGIYYPDEGHILIDGKNAVISSPHDAFAYKIGMIHQHFKLVDVFTAAENVVLGVKQIGGLNPQEALAQAEVACRREGLEMIQGEQVEVLPADGKHTVGVIKARSGDETVRLIFGLHCKGGYSKRSAVESVRAICTRYGFELDPNKKIYNMSVSEKQTVEIVKVLYRGADILILDEPTAVLTPQETEKLFAVLRRMRDDGKAIIIITHKLHEVMAISDRVSVLRKGSYIGTVRTAETNEAELTEMMVGKRVSLNIERTEPRDPQVRLAVHDISSVSPDGVQVLDHVSFEARSGEILGIAGIAGSGQRELLESIAGLYAPDSGEILYNDPKDGETVDLRRKTPIQIRELGVRLSFVPEDRLGMGLVGNMSIVDNMMLRSYRAGTGAFLHRTAPKNLAGEIIRQLEVVTPSDRTPVRRLSGGNVQKVLVGREIAAAPTVLMAAYPVRGLDINSSYMIYNLLNKQKESGVAVIFVGEDLDVLLELCDRIMVISGGRVAGILDGRTAKKDEVGLLMTGTEGGKAQ
ncbi:MAG TPA: ABC transporter ATP-binding protein [Clostridiales bacterium]|nr:ABC transporter ATP-binding protein [Clostridiales bacterium]